MARRILLLTVVMALLGLTATAWAGPPDFPKAPKANDLIKKAAQCPGGDCGTNCQLKSWLNANAADQKVFARSDCNGYLGDSTMLNSCKKTVAAIPEEFTCKGVVVVATMEPCALLGKKVAKKDATSDKCGCPSGTHETADKLHCECDEKELAGKFVVAGQNVDKTCMTRDELAAAKKRHDDEARRLAALQREKDREAYEKAKRWNAYHQTKLHPSEDGFADTCPADISEKVSTEIPEFPELCVCLNCPEYLRDELSPNDPWVLKKGGNEECPDWFAYALAILGWVGVIGIPLILLALIALIIFLIKRKKKGKKTPPKGPGAPTGVSPTPSDGEVPPLPPVDAASFEALEAKLLDRLTSSDEGGFLHPDHPFMKAVIAKLGATMVSRTDFEEALEVPPEPLLDAVIAALKPELVREQSRELFADIIARHQAAIEHLTPQIEVMKAQGEAADPAQLQALELERRVHETCRDEAQERDRLLAGLDEDH
ncbi:hypothetical protein JW752_03845 [Candidatus Peregrinibacteria bacterium]|nr:hypothetical protein [Candidatus Peregrinibacteria bacterium]